VCTVPTHVLWYNWDEDVTGRECNKDGEVEMHKKKKVGVEEGEGK